MSNANANTHKDTSANPPQAASAISQDLDASRNATEFPGDLENYRKLMSLAKDALLVLNTTGVILEWNESGASLLDLLPSEIAGMRVQSLLVNEQETFFEDFLSQIFDSPSVKRCELHLKRADGPSRSIQFVAQRSCCGQMCFASLTHKDLFAEKAQLDAEKKMEAIGLFASGIAHDFNNILSVIDGYAGALLINRSEDDPFFMPLQEICSASAHGAYLTKQMLAFSKRQVLKPELLDLDKVVRSNFALLSRVTPSNVTLNLVEGHGVDPIWAESGQVAQVLLNLVAYASDLIGDGGGSISIEISNSQTDAPDLSIPSYALLAISVLSENIATNSSNNDQAGKRPEENCVGLLTAKKVLTRLGGKLAESSDANSGQLNAYFPQIQQRSCVVPRTSESSRSLVLNPDVTVATTSLQCKANILLVEDDYRIRELAGQILSKNGYNVLSASSGEEALELCRNFAQEIELLVCDVVLPGMSGTEIASQIREKRPSIRILMMSGYISESLSCGNIDGKYFDHIEKPFSAKALLTKLSDLLAL